jgi:mannonate dehydratase
MAEQTMRVAVGQIRDLDDEILRYAVQLGVKGVQINTPLIPGDGFWSESVLRAQVEKCEQYGLVLESLENVPAHFYDKAMLGLPGRDEQIENYQTTIRNVGKAGIPILGFHFIPNFVWRTEYLAPTRGDAKSTLFDMAAVEHATQEELESFVWGGLERNGRIPVAPQNEIIVSREQMWENYVYFIKAVLPVAEEAGVKLALHPDDPPVPMLGGVGRIFCEPAGFRRAYELNPDSPSWGLNLCLGCCSEMPGGVANVREMIEFFGPRGKIHYSHFRDVQGTLPRFQECFIGDGNYDPAEIITLLKKNGFIGFLLDDHVPYMDDDTEYGHRGRAHAIGYIQGLLRMLEFAG